MLGTDCLCTCHSFLVGWSPYSLGCSNTCRDWHFPVLNDIMKYLNHVTLGCLFLSPTFWKINGFVLSLILSFFIELPTWAKVALTLSNRSFKYHANMFPLMCGSRGRCLVINLSYHMCISFIFSPFFNNITYLSWLATSYSCPSFIVLIWSYHWWSKYPFVLVLWREWMYISPWNTSRYFHSCFGKWNTCSKGGLWPFPLPHMMTSEYLYLCK
jgi:hypothetical protein